MAAAVKALNARIRANKYADYFCSTHFWGPASNFGIPIAAVADMSKDPEIISGRMTGALSVYSAVFMRYAFAVSPANYLLFGCHFINCSSQLVQGYRYMQYWNFGGRDAALKAKELADSSQGMAAAAADKAKDAVKSVGK
ncbi:hypothetical protein BDV95DRAFT_561678 [Massariosphaeria phaeospora]|uniref:Mitochondrial pyruvate carrier n=1 Tax=Massariosphaeria phaeospora TaxID=100035 RepID=A0A7C8IGU5_9PLEO|nr:hypothetical protein BDV95DRAFT_561678 [Massariosphaeria phaeospora]